MAKVTRFLKLRVPSTGEILSIKMAKIKLISPLLNQYTILEKGDNLNPIIEKYGVDTDENYKITENFEIVGTKNILGFVRKNYTDNNGYNYFLFMSNSIHYNKNNAKFTNSGGALWTNAMLYPMLGYEENYGVFFPVTYYGIATKHVDTKRYTFDDFEPPYTPPTSEIIIGDSTEYPCISRTSTNEFTLLTAYINNNNFDDLAYTDSLFYNILKNYDDNPDTGEPTESPFDIEYGFPGEPSSPQGGDGNMKDTNEPLPLTPSDITNVAYPVRCYRLSRANVSALHGYLWSNDFITNLPKLFSDPFSAIVGIQAIPYISPAEESNIIIGTLDTNIVANKVTLYYVTVDLGSINVTEYWQNFLDYQPYTRLKLFLPYIGIVDLPTDLFMNNSVAVKYRIDIVSGACVAIVSNRDNIICTFTGNCSTKIPLSNNDHSNAIGNTLVGIAGLAGSVATGNAVGAVANTASIVAGLKERIQISGSLSTAHGILINDKPFLMIERPDTEIPENYAGLKGYTSNISMKLSETTGFTKISDIKLDGLSCTDEEKDELLNMMQNGIYL